MPEANQPQVTQSEAKPASASGGGAAEPQDNSIIETLQSLIVAFVLAMTFRGFVTEGFVIPTGSMAPTLLGQHKRLRSEQTGWEFAAGSDARLGAVSLDRVPDPMLGPSFAGTGSASRHARTRMGDRILVLKGLYHFAEPTRYDVVVFKNPTNPNGEDGNYIKRLIGLPGEAIWLADGDVFAGSGETPDDYDAYRIQRKPEYIQRAVWQPVHDTDFFPRHPESIDQYYFGAPWQGDGWETDGAPPYRCNSAEPTILEWDSHIRAVDDWAAYNVLVQGMARGQTVPVSDLRMSTTIVANGEGLETVFELVARGHQMQFILAGGEARVRLRSREYGEAFPDEGWTDSTPVPFAGFPVGRPMRVELWHVDQTLKIFLDGERVVSFEYDWGPVERLEHAVGRVDDPGLLASAQPAAGPEMRFRFQGAPVDLDRMRVDRDLYYRVDRLNKHARKNPTIPGFEPRVRRGQYGFGTHPDNLAILDEDQFFMAGDNSAASSDSRLWGNPHPLVATQIDPSPFLVHRKLLLGKAWVVYFPAPHALREDGRAFIPDFGRLRFIR